ETFLDGAETARQRMLTGTFPDSIVSQFAQMLDYFGQCPIIVRSSSLLEDNFGNAFAGKYDSVFCVNQGHRDQRLEDFLSAVRSIYASSMSERALRYRAQRGLLDRDEQMALLVQRVSGAVRGDLFYPEMAGVGLSFNPYVWSEHIDPHAGVLRLVFGLGTRAVDRSDDDYTRIVALNAPRRRPEAGFDQVRRYAQRRVDCLDLEANRLTSLALRDVLARSQGLAMDMFASRDEEAEERASTQGASAACPWVLTFDRLLSDTDYVETMREMLRVLEEAYGYPVDVEFTTNFLDGSEYRIGLVQCRPLQVREGGAAAAPPTDVPRERLVLRAHGAVIGHSAPLDVDRIIYVVPSAYGRLPTPDRYAVARLIGDITRSDVEARTVLLAGPGRWGTSTPSLGVPVTFSDIHTISALCEIVAMRDDLVPDVSLGTHFLNELIEMDILYLALFPGRDGNWLNSDLLERAPSRLLDLIPDAGGWDTVVRVLDSRALGGRNLRLHADVLRQDAVCCVDGG
ncbi:MAG TPA: PEP/pyruvate-binding domain-containing protein, partial [Armatimonadota bacterium]|nr:PEP/pyruvate-binding domain-containing protein [Armatimonadota bacterium]